MHSHFKIILRGVLEVVKKIMGDHKQCLIELFKPLTSFKKGPPLPLIINTVEPALTTTSEQRPPFNNGWFDSSTASLYLTFIRPLFQTATFSKSPGWSLYTGFDS